MMTIDFSAYRILVIEDSEINFFVLKSMLDQESFDVTWASNAKVALEILGHEQIDLILMDVVMNEMDGFELTQQLKSTAHRDIPILFVTSLNSPEDIVKGFDSGGSDYVTKPFNRGELLRRIKHQITLIHSRRTIIRQTEELQTALDNRDKLYAILAHDLRSPISSLKMIFNILTMQNGAPSFSPEYVDMLYSGNDIAEKLFNLLDNLLKWTKTSLGVLHYNPQEFELADAVRGVVEVLLPTAKLKQITFEMQLEEDVDIYFDMDIMKSVLRNLLINAVKFSHPSSSILLRLYEENGYAVFEVIDYGIGMSKEAQEQLRLRIHGNAHPGTGKEEGTGLGLWIVQHFITQHQGEFNFESRENEGSRFYIKIPSVTVEKNKA